MNNPLVVHLTVEDLTLLIEESVQKIIQKNLPPPPVNYLTGTELLSKFRISRPTLLSYERKGILHRVSLGNKKLFKESDVEAALVSFPKYKRVKLSA